MSQVLSMPASLSNIILGNCPMKLFIEVAASGSFHFNILNKVTTVWSRAGKIIGCMEIIKCKCKKKWCGIL